MPLYEYQCEPCGHRFEVIQKFSDPPIEVCPKCGGAVHKLLSSPAIQFKGSGWYITDYARAGRSDSAPGESGKNESASASADKPVTDSKADGKADNKAESKAESKSGKSKSGKSESKPESKSETKPSASPKSD